LGKFNDVQVLADESYVAFKYGQCTFSQHQADLVLRRIELETTTLAHPFKKRTLMVGATCNSNFIFGNELFGFDG
jgi:hypothetical protein